MSDGELVARHYSTGEPIRVNWRAGKIVAIDEVQSSPQERWIAPPLFDLQINGYAGVDFQQDGLTVEHLLHAVRRLREDGCTKFLLTLITDEWPRLTARFRHLAALRTQHPELAAAISGWHIEGPFLSAEPGYCGAHDPACMMDPTDAHIDELCAIAGDAPLLVTIAPERRGTVAVIRRARELGVFVQLGHSNAPLSVLREATGTNTFFTHLGNACPQSLDRHDNILWRVLDVPSLGASLIPDGTHVSPELFRLIHRIKGNRLYYTTDAMSAAGAPPGRYRLGRTEVEVGADRVVRLPGQSNFAGSACTPIGGVFRAAKMLGEKWQDAWHRFSETPSRVLNRSNILEAGAPADFCVLTFPDEPPEAPRLQTYVGGEFFQSNPR